MHCAPSHVPDQITANRRSVSGLLGLCCVILQCVSAAAQPAGPESIRAWGLASLDDGLQVLDSVPVLPVPGIYAAALAREALEDQAFGPLPVASVFRMSIVAFDNREGLTEESQLVDSDRQLTWRLRLASAGSESLGLGFTRYYMPPGGRLFVFTPDYQEILGPFTDADNRSHGELWIPRLPGEEIVVEISVPADAVADLQVEIGAVERGFLDRQSDAWRSCQTDVVCDEGRHHRNAIRSVAYLEITGPSLVYGCSGALINNTRYDWKPYLLTAFHCGSAGEDHDVGTWWTTSKAASLKVYWNYESPTCGARSGGSLRHVQVGATVQAGYYNTDFALLLLDEEPMPTAGYRQFFAGWSRNPNRYKFVVGIHHPGGTEKSLAVDDRGPYGANVYPTSSAWDWDWCSSGDLCDGLIVYWDKGVPAGISSGSPLFNGNQRILGQLWGGAADSLLVCGNSRYGPTTGASQDRRGRSLSGMSGYGWLKGSWPGGGTASTRLRDWLDPGGVTNPISIPGIDSPTENSNLVVLTPIASAASPLRPNQIFRLSATVRNLGRGPSPRTRLRWYRRRVGERWSLKLTADIFSIQPSRRRTHTISGEAAPREPGEYQYAACVNVVRYESNTTDNCSRALSVTVRDVAGMPDLVVRNARVSDSTPVVGQQFRLYADVHNIGTAASETTRLRYWRRPLEGNWERVGDNDYVPPFVPGRRVAYSTLLTAQPGMHEYTACVVPVRGEPSGSNCSRPYLTVTGGNLGGALFIATDGVMAAATSETRAFFGDLGPEYSEPREELELIQNGAALSGQVALFGIIRGGTFDPLRGYLGSKGFPGTPPIAVDGSIATSSNGRCPCTVRLSGSDSEVSYSLSGTINADGNRIAGQVEIRSHASFFPPQIGPSTYERQP